MFHVMRSVLRLESHTNSLSPLPYDLRLGLVGLEGWGLAAVDGCGGPQCALYGTVISLVICIPLHLIISVHVRLWLHRCIRQNQVSSSMPERS